MQCKSVWWAAWLVFAVASAAADAQVYKWTDAQGRLHYSDMPPPAATTQVAQVKVPASAPATPSMPTWQQREADYKRRHAADKRRGTPVPGGHSASPVPAYHRNAVETDADRCRLGRDIASGMAQPVGRARIDEHDRETARSDVRSFCR